MQAALVKVLLGNVQLASMLCALDEGILAVQHNMVMDIGTLLDPGTAGLCVGASHNQLFQHRLYNLGHRACVLVRVDSGAACGTRLAAVGLGGPSMVETVAAEEVTTYEQDGAGKGRVADEADEVAVRRRDVLEEVEVGRLLGGGGTAVLREQ